MKKIVSFNTVAEVTVTVTVPDEVQTRFADDEDGLRDWIIEEAVQNAPSQPCGNCAGFNYNGTAITLGELEFGIGFKIDHTYDDSDDVRDAKN